MVGKTKDRTRAAWVGGLVGVGRDESLSGWGQELTGGETRQE